MTTEPRHEHPDPPSKAARPRRGAASDSAPVRLECPSCHYELTGLGPAGRCPECGETYTRASVLRLRPRPGAGAMLLRLAWSFVVLLGTGVIVSGSAAESGDLAIGFTVFALIVMLVGWIDGAAYIASMPQRYVVSRRAPELPTPLLVLLWVGGYAVIAPCLFAGGCMVGAAAS